MPSTSDTAYIIFDTESVVDGALLARVLYPGDELSPTEAVARLEETLRREDPEDKGFIPVSFQVPVGIGVARVGADFKMLDLASLDSPRFDPQSMVKLFWRGIQLYSDAVLVDFNGRRFDLPLLTLAAFRFGVSCPRYFEDPDRYGFRYRFTSKHLDLLEWLTEYGAFPLRGGLNLMAKMLGKPGKMSTKGDQVHELYLAGKVKEINEYCLQDVLDTYFIFLRTRVLAGRLSLEEEQRIVQDTRAWLGERSASLPSLKKYLAEFGSWDPAPFK